MCDVEIKSRTNLWPKTVYKLVRKQADGVYASPIKPEDRIQWAHSDTPGTILDYLIGEIVVSYQGPGIFVYNNIKEARAWQHTGMKILKLRVPIFSRIRYGYNDHVLAVNRVKVIGEVR